MTHLNEQIIDAFIESEADVELIVKENEEEVLFNLRILDDLFAKRNLLMIVVGVGHNLKLSNYIYRITWLLNYSVLCSTLVVWLVIG